MVTGTFSKLPDDAWGVLVDGPVSPGVRVRVDKRDGSVSEVEIDEVLCEVAGVSLCSLVRYSDVPDRLADFSGISELVRETPGRSSVQAPPGRVLPNLQQAGTPSAPRVFPGSKDKHAVEAGVCVHCRKSGGALSEPCGRPDLGRMGFIELD